MTPELDRIRARYAERDAAGGESEYWTLANPVVLHLAQERERALLEMLARLGLALAGRRLLDIGCGRGGEFANYERWGAAPVGLYGIDLVEARLAAARRASGAALALASGSALPWPDAAFDAVVLNVVLSSVPGRPLRRAIAAEALRVLRPGGFLLWHDIARQRLLDPHLAALPQAEVESLFAPLRWNWRRVGTHLGLLRRLHAVAGARALLAFDLLFDWAGFAKTHLLGIGMRPPAGEPAQ
jgi:SAM-dependent methyltransferase